MESQNIENMVTFSQVDKVKENSERDHSPPSDTKSAYSSVVGAVSLFYYCLVPLSLTIFNFIELILSVVVSYRSYLI